MCTSHFVTEMSHCLECLEETQDEEEFQYCICEMHRNSLPAWNTCSDCLRVNYNDQTLETWSSECLARAGPGSNLSGGMLYKCKNYSPR